MKKIILFNLDRTHHDKKLTKPFFFLLNTDQDVTTPKQLTKQKTE